MPSTHGVEDLHHLVGPAFGYPIGGFVELDVGTAGSNHIFQLLVDVRHQRPSDLSFVAIDVARINSEGLGDRALDRRDQWLIGERTSIAEFIGVAVTVGHGQRSHGAEGVELIGPGYPSLRSYSCVCKP